MKLFRRKSREPVERGDQQDFLEALLFAQANGLLLNTTMPALDEETVVGSLGGLAKANGPVFALMVARLQVFSQVRFVWSRFDNGERSDFFGNAELSVLERPWRGGTTADLLARMEIDVTTAGNAYVRRIDSRRSGPRLVRMRPDWVTVVLGSNEDVDHPAEAADVEVVGYAYTPRQRPESMQLFEPDEVAHYAPIPDPDALFLGMSWITPVLRDVQGDNLQTDHKRAFLRNAATPNLAIKFDPSQTIEQVKAFKELMEAEHKGAANAYKTLFLGGGADPITVGKDFKEIDFAVTQGKAESRLAAAAGVPPSWVGFSEGLQGSALNAGNFTSARRRYGDGTLAHLWGNAAASLEAIVRPPNGAHLWYSTRGIPFLLMDATDEANVQATEAQTIVALVRDGFSAESAIDAVTNRDWNRLDHIGLLSVQLQEPGEDPNGPQGGPDDDDPDD